MTTNINYSLFIANSLRVASVKMSQQEPQLSPDDVIQKLGGCGRFQVRVTILVHLIKTLSCLGWSGGAMVLGNFPVLGRPDFFGFR